MLRLAMVSTTAAQEIALKSNKWLKQDSAKHVPGSARIEVAMHFMFGSAASVELLEQRNFVLTNLEEPAYSHLRFEIRGCVLPTPQFFG